MTSLMLKATKISHENKSTGKATFYFSAIFVRLHCRINVTEFSESLTSTRFLGVDSFPFFLTPQMSFAVW